MSCNTRFFWPKLDSTGSVSAKFAADSKEVLVEGYVPSDAITIEH
jgi:hypothetical protein